MKLIVGIILMILVSWLFFRHKIRHFQENMSEEEQEEFAAFLAEEQQAQAESQAVLQKLVVYRTLNASVHEGMTLEEMIDAFAEMCKISVGDPDDLLFETGTFDLDGEKLFCFFLVRQFQFLDAEEFVQLRLEVTYPPNPKTALLYTTKWDARVEGDFFEMVKSGKAFHLVKDMPIHTATVRIEET